MFILAASAIAYLFPPGLTEMSSGWSSIHRMWLLAALSATVMLYIANRKLSKIILVIGIYFLVSVLSTIWNGGDYYELFVTFGKPIGFCMLIEVGLEYNARKTVKILYCILGIEVIANLITIWIFPNGMYTTNYYYEFTQNWFLGYDNLHNLFILPALCLSMINAEYNKKSFVAKLCIIVLFSASVFITWSATSIVAISVWILLWLYVEITNNYRILSIGMSVGVHTVFFFSIIIIRMQNLLEWLIVDILGKDLTFTGRTSRWDAALRMFQEKPLFGWGVAGTELTRLRLEGFSHCHNHFLQILYQTGIAGMVCFLITLFLLFKPIREMENKKIAFILLDTLFCYLIVGQIEAIMTTTTLYGLITMAYHARKLEQGDLESPQKRIKIRFVRHGKRVTYLR